jgi:hypothetical protein
VISHPIQAYGNSRRSSGDLRISHPGTYRVEPCRLIAHHCTVGFGGSAANRPAELGDHGQKGHCCCSNQECESRTPRPVALARSTASGRSSRRTALRHNRCPAVQCRPPGAGRGVQHRVTNAVRDKGTYVHLVKMYDALPPPGPPDGIAQAGYDEMARSDSMPSGRLLGAPSSRAFPGTVGFRPRSSFSFRHTTFRCRSTREQGNS